MHPKVVIENLVYRRIMHWVNKSNHEVSGLGIVVVEPEGVLRVTHAMLLPQVNGPTHTDIEPEDAARMLYKCKDIPGDLRFWWHSHVDMNVFWSGTDIDTIKKVGQGGWFLSTVFNKKREMLSAFYSIDGTKTPWGSYPLFQDKLETKVEPYVDQFTEQWDAEYTENVKERKPYSHFQQYPWAVENRDVGGHVRSVGNQLSTINPLHDLRKRPLGMSKTQWKKMRKNPIQPPSEPLTDVYGFSQEERNFLARLGWDQKDIDTLFEEDVSPQDMLVLAGGEMEPDEILDLLENDWTLQDILAHCSLSPEDDGPVMDNSQGGKYDA